jgi:putative transposase
MMRGLAPQARPQWRGGSARTRGHFPTDDAAMKLLFLVLRDTAREWKMPPREWFEAKTQFAIMFDERFVQA